MNIIDFHCHPGYDFYRSVHGIDIDNDRFFSDLSECGIEKCCGSVIDEGMCARPIEEYETLVPALNDRAIKIALSSGGRYIPGIHIHPMFVEMSCREIERCHKRGVKLIGELVPYMMGYQSCSGRNFLEIMDCAASYSMVVNIHPTTIPDMVALSEAMPRLKLVWAHFSGYGGLQAHIDMMKKYRNVCFDISAHGTDAVGTLRGAIDRVGYDKLLFGTDYPGIGPATDIAAVMFEDLSDEEREAIFYKNAKRLLEL